MLILTIFVINQRITYARAFFIPYKYMHRTDALIVVSERFIFTLFSWTPAAALAGFFWLISSRRILLNQLKSTGF